jgi:hypothetical protein
MSVVMSAALQRKAVKHMSRLIAQTMDEEIMNLNAFMPDLTKRLPSIFADSVLNSFSSILGEATGEALVRFIGEDNLESPSEVYDRLDEYLQGGSELVKGAILEEFRVRIHKLYKMATNAVAKSGSIQP